MALFQLEKWHFDLLTSEETYVLLTASRARLAGLRGGRIGLHVAPAAGGPVPTVHRSFHAVVRPRPSPTTMLETQFGGVSVSPSRAGLALTLPGTIVSLQYTSACPTDFASAALHIAASKGHAVSWQPLSLKSLVAGHLLIDAMRIGVGRSGGYVDHVRSNIFPTAVPVRTRYWSRVHGPDLDVAFTCAEGRPGRAGWNRAIADCKGKLHVFKEVMLRSTGKEDAGGCPCSYEVMALSREARLTVALEHRRVAVDSRVADDTVFRNPALRLLYRWSTKSPRGAKYVSRARVELVAQGGVWGASDVPCVDEVVRFGW